MLLKWSVTSWFMLRDLEKNVNLERSSKEELGSDKDLPNSRGGKAETVAELDLLIFYPFV